MLIPLLTHLQSLGLLGVVATCYPAVTPQMCCTKLKLIQDDIDLINKKQQQQQQQLLQDTMLSSPQCQVATSPNTDQWRDVYPPFTPINKAIILDGEASDCSNDANITTPLATAGLSQ